MARKIIPYVTEKDIKKKLKKMKKGEKIYLWGNRIHFGYIKSMFNESFLEQSLPIILGIKKEKDNSFYHSIETTKYIGLDIKMTNLESFKKKFENYYAAIPFLSTKKLLKIINFYNNTTVRFYYDFDDFIEEYNNTVNNYKTFIENDFKELKQAYEEHLIMLNKLNTEGENFKLEFNNK